MRIARLRAHAKVNLSLRITGTRRDGYHDLRTLYQALALHDDLTIVERNGPFTIDCDDPRVPCDESNLVWRAAALLWELAGRQGPPRDARVSIVKRIPVQAGLGGGSADGAAALRGLAALWGIRPPEADLLSLGARIGADAAFFLVGGCALGLDRGDTLYPLTDIPALDVVLVVPRFGVSTAEAYKWFDEWDSAGRTGPQPPGFGRLPGNWPASSGRVDNDLEAPVAARHPEIGEHVSFLREAGATAAAMSGSGSSVFGLFTSAVAARAAARVAEGCGLRALRTRTIGREEYERSSSPRWLARSKVV